MIIRCYLTAFVLFFVCALPDAAAYPFWQDSPNTLAEQLEVTDVVVRSAKRGSGADTTFEIEQVIYVREGVDTPAVGLQLTFDNVAKPTTDAQLVLLSKQAEGFRVVQTFAKHVEALADYVAERQRLVCAEETACMQFFWKHLESKNKFVAEDSFYRLAAQSFDALDRNAVVFGRSKLKRWASSAKVPGQRRDFYAMLIGMKGNPGDGSALTQVMDAFLSQPSLRNVPMVGVLIGYALSGSRYAQPMVMKTARMKPVQKEHKKNVLDAAEFLLLRGDTKAKPWLPRVLGYFLGQSLEYKLRALSVAERAVEPSLAAQVAPLYDKSTTSEELKSAIGQYCVAVEAEPCVAVKKKHEERQLPIDTSEAPEENESL